MMILLTRLHVQYLENLMREALLQSPLSLSALPRFSMPAFDFLGTQLLRVFYLHLLQVLLAL